MSCWRKSLRSGLQNEQPTTPGVPRWPPRDPGTVSICQETPAAIPCPRRMNASKAIGKALVASPERKLEADADLAVVRQVQAGDVAAFDRLIVKYRERVLGIIYNMTSNSEDAADLAQDAFIKAFQSINRFQGQASFFTWLYRIAVNSTVTHLRKNRLRSFFSLEAVREDDPVSKELIDALTDKT